MALKILRNDIVKMTTEAIVNTASAWVEVGDGCDTAVYQAAGEEALLKYRQEKIGEKKEGDAFITPGFNLPAKYIIHAVSPIFIDGNRGEEDKLRACYRNSLKLAKENNIKSISFPLIATGSFGYPKAEGLRIAVDELNDFLLHNDMEVYIVVFDGKATKLGEKLYPDLQHYIDNNYVDEKRAEEYGARDFGEMPDMCAKPAPKASRRPKLFTLGGEARNKNQKEEADERLEIPSARREKPAVDFAPKEEAVYDAAVMSIDEEEDYLEKLKAKLDERQAHLADTFSEYLLYLIETKGYTNVEVYKAACVDKKLFAKIKNDSTYHPQKITCLCLCIGAHLNLDETIDLLARAGYALSPCDMRDVIFKYFIENEIYDIIGLDIQLEEYGIPCIIA